MEFGYEDICKIIGSLVLDAHRQTAAAETKSKQLVTQLQHQLEVLQSENERLKGQLATVCSKQTSPD
jgi:hypothetical protein